MEYISLYLRAYTWKRQFNNIIPNMNQTFYIDLGNSNFYFMSRREILFWKNVNELANEKKKEWKQDLFFSSHL